MYVAYLYGHAFLVLAFLIYIYIMLCIIFRFFIGVALYLIIGVIIMKCVKGATGVEMIPNYKFWSDLPLLIRVHYIKLLRYFIFIH